jgi:AcrR family transcriptional regulator
MDADGIDALTMRKLAADLDVEAMSLYYHVPGKAALLEGLAGCVLAEVELPSGEAKDWQEASRAVARVASRICWKSADGTGSLARVG